MSSLLSQTARTTITEVELYFHRFRLITSILRRVDHHDTSTTFPFVFPFPPETDTYVASRAIRYAPTPAAALFLFHSIHTHHQSHHTIHALARTLSISRRISDIQSLVHAIDSGIYPNANHPFPIDRLRWFSTAGDLPSSLHAWDNVGRRPCCVESYNLVFGLYVGLEMDGEAVGVLRRMVEDGISPNSRTYTVIMEHLVRKRRVDVAVKVFDRLPMMRIRRTSKQYNVLADGLSASGDFDGLKTLISEMRSDGILPGIGMRRAMVKMQDAGYLDRTEEFVVELSSTEHVGSFCNHDDDDDDEDGDCVLGLKLQLDADELACALGNWDQKEVEALTEAQLFWTSRLVCKFIRGFENAETAWKFFCWVSQSHQSGGFKHDRYTISRMITALARSGHEGLVDRIISMVKSEGISLPFSTIRLIVDFYGISNKAEASLRILRDVTSICGTLSNDNWVLLCSTLLRTLVKCKRGNTAMKVLEEIMAEGVVLDVPSYSGLMQFFLMEGDMRNVQKILHVVKTHGLKPDACMYQILIRAYIKHRRLDLAMRVFAEMRDLSLVPDTKTKSLLVRRLWSEGKRREASYVEERCDGVAVVPPGLTGRPWTASSRDLIWVYETYRKSVVNEGKCS